MSILQDRLAKEILTSKTMKEAGLKAGYKVDKARTIYRASTKRHIAEVLKANSITKETMLEYFRGLTELAIKEKDLSNANRSGENIARLYNLLKDNTIQQTLAVFDKTIEQDRQKIVNDASSANCNS
jgi:hypothetical protein